LLEVFDFKCQIFDRPEKFLAAHTRGRFDCLITDLNMKGMSGLELQQKLSAADPDLPIIFISAQSAPEAKSEALRLGAAAFLSKPISDDVLHRHIISALSLRSME
jgi:FixJ family two-component response regulator